MDELYQRVASALDAGPRSWELIFVDDGSADGTFARIELLHAADERVHAIRFKRNFGQHPRCTPGSCAPAATSS